MSKWASKTSAFSGASGSPWGRWQFLDDAGQHVFDADAGLGGNRDRLKRIQPQFRIDLLTRPVDVRGREIDLVDHRQQFQIVFQGQVKVGNRLGLDPLEASTTINAPSHAISERRTSCEKSTWPGVSIRFNR